MNICSPNRSAAGLPESGKILSAPLAALQICSDAGIRIAGHMMAAQSALQGEVLRQFSTSGIQGSGDSVALRQIHDHSMRALGEAIGLTQNLQAYSAAILGPGSLALPRETGSGRSG